MLNFHSLLTFCFIITFSFHLSEATKTRYMLQRGSSLTVQHNTSDFLTSPDGSFTCGFYGVGTNAFWFSIWFANSKDRTIVWMANRDRPVNGLGSKSSLTRDGSLFLTDVDGTRIWSPILDSTSANLAESLALLDSGNLVLRGPQGEVLWQSFDFPTHTLLPNQVFTKDMRLVSSKLRKGDYSSGYHNLYFDSDNVLRLVYDGPDMSSVYWPDPNFNAFKNGRLNYNSTRVAVFDDLGTFLSSDGFEFDASDKGLGFKRRLTMDYDGNLRMYSLDSKGFWVVTWEAMIQICRINGLCGRNGICVYTPKPKCSCPPGYEVVDKTNWNKGCKPKFELTCSEPVEFIEMPIVDFYGFDVIKNNSISFEACWQLCLDDCNCKAFRYKQVDQLTLNNCFIKEALFNGHKSSYYVGALYLKVPKSMNYSSNDLSVTDSCSDNEATDETLGSAAMYDKPTKRVRWVYLYYFAYAVGGVEFLFIVSGWWLLFRRHGAVAPTLHDDFRRISSHFRMYLYAELKKATRNFKVELGRGASGAVYKGVLEDTRVVAVKKLEEIYEAEEVFWAEVTTIGKIHHMNLVRTWGFCSEGKHRLLITEFVENGSLDKHLFYTSSFLGWQERFKVAMGVAKGLAYLHHECLEWVIHCDVKPENVLLNSEFEPKIADFGLAKLSQRGSRGSHISRMRGTKGYIAPEWASNLPITAKVDVYSYGVMILEIVKGIRLSNWVAVDGDHEEEDIETEMSRFIREVKHGMQCSGEEKEEETWIEGMVDPRLLGDYNRRQAAKMVEIGIMCVEEDRSRRPTMDAIVQMLSEC